MKLGRLGNFVLVSLAVTMGIAVLRGTRVAIAGDPKKVKKPDLCPNVQVTAPGAVANKWRDMGWFTGDIGPGRIKAHWQALTGSDDPNRWVRDYDEMLGNGATGYLCAAESWDKLGELAGQALVSSYWLQQYFAAVQPWCNAGLRLAQSLNVQEGPPE